VDRSNGCALTLVANGALTNAQGQIVPAGLFRSVVIGDFGGTGRDKIRALQKNSDYNYIWSVTLPSTNNSLGSYQLFTSGPLKNSQGQSVNVDDLTFVDVAVLDSTDPNNLSAMGETVLVAIQGNDWVYEWGVNPNSEYEIPLCTNSRCQNKSVIFSLDQGYANGLLRYQEGQNPAIYQNVLNALVAFKNANYNLSVVINPIDNDPVGLSQTLDFLTNNGISFYLDVYASDTATIGLVESNLTSPLVSTPTSNYFNQGLSVDLTTLSQIKTKYKNSFAGIRIFETGGFDYICSQNPSQSGCPNNSSSTRNVNFFNEALVKQYVDFAHSVNMKALLVDYMFIPIWGQSKSGGTYSRFNTAVSDLVSQQADPNTLVFAYENNEVSLAGGSPLHRINSWNQATLRVPGSAGLGISNQAWMCSNKPGFDTFNCPPEYFEIWTASAFMKQGGSVVQFEPFWTFFNWPMGSIANSIPALPSTTAKNGLGSPTASLCAIAKSMSVTLSNCP